MYENYYKKVYKNPLLLFLLCLFLLLELLKIDTKVDWLELNRVIALMVGYKYVNKYQFIQNNTISPLEWTDLKQPPDFRNIYDRVLNQYLLDHMPRSHKDMSKKTISFLDYF